MIFSPYLKKTKRMRGLTLLELLVYFGVFAIIVGVLVGFIVWVFRSNIKAQTMRETLTNARRALETMVYEIKGAKSVYTPTATQLSLETSHYLPAGELSSYIDFFLCDSQLCLKKEGELPIALTSSKVEVKSLNFEIVSTTSTVPSVQLSLQVNYKNPAGLSEYQASVSVTSTASLRGF